MRFTVDHLKSLCFGATFSFLTYFVHNPFFDSCTLVGCNYGKGFPIPFYFDTFCAPGAVNCVEGYFSGATFLFDFIFMALLFFGTLHIYRLFSGYTNDSDIPAYKIRK
jgi:hypothetical protein